MANSYSQIYIQVVFAVRGRENLIHREWEEELYQYISGIVRKKGQKLIVINGMPDHIHILIGIKPDCCLSDLIRDLKKSSNDWINENKFLRHKFHWQEGFGAFSYGRSQLDQVVKYITNQKEHHKKKSFRMEYLDFLKKYEIEYNEKYLFEWLD